MLKQRQQEEEAFPMTADFKQAYYRRLLPALVAFGAAVAARGLDEMIPLSPVAARMAGVVLFAGAIIVAVGLPVWIRAAFANRVRLQRGVEEADFTQFQRRLITAALLTPYLAAVAVALPLDGFYQAGAVLASLYAVYYHYPSPRRIAFDRRLFRVGRPQTC